MKKYITVAALLVAGAAFANATNHIDFSESWALNTLLEEKSYKGTGLFSFEFVVSETSYDTSYDSAVVLKLGDMDAALFTQIGRYLGINTTIDGTIDHGKDENNKDIDTWLPLNPTKADDHNYSGPIQDGWFRDLGATPTNAIVGQKVEVSYDGASKLSLTIANQTTTFTGIENLNANDFKLGTKITASNVKVTAVPEPSAFGLLAGIGALALVASRRRRK